MLEENLLEVTLVYKKGPVEVNDIIERYVQSNAARFNVQQNMFNDLNAAETLGIEDGALRKTI
jgi:hypothetical protein